MKSIGDVFSVWRQIQLFYASEAPLELAPPCLKAILIRKQLIY